MIGISATPGTLTALRAHSANLRALTGSLERLATGQRINRGSDDPAGLITSENLRAVLSALEAESRSMQRADHVAAVAEGGLAGVSDLLVEANGLVVANANSAGLSEQERQANQMQLDSILASIDSIAGSNTFNGQALLNGTATVSAGGVSVDIDSASTGNLGEVEIDGETYTLASLGAGGSLNIVDGDLESAQQVIQAAISDVSTMRGRLGAFQRNTVGAGLNSVQISIENIAAANSQIRDTDYAKETVTLRRAELLTQASLLALTLQNSAQARILALLG